MKRRSIIFLPTFENQQQLTMIRQKYDPLATKITPHISLVFPFDSALTTSELIKHIHERTAHLTAFQTAFRSFSGSLADGTLFLDCILGNDTIIDFHDSLYTGCLANELYNETPYFPHITVGSVDDSATF